jgi:hypothetical protein
MGGKITERVTQATHILINKSGYSLKKNEIEKITNIKIVNIKFIFHTYYHMMKMNESDNEYKLI